jgi:hypothetical protein
MIEPSHALAAAGWLIALTAVAATAGHAAGQAAQPAASPPAQLESSPHFPHHGPAGVAAAKLAHRSREGSLLTDLSGSFEFVGDRVVFVPAGSQDSYRVLENLALERIVHELGDARDQRSWTVTGQLTEFRGANYLLVAKALIKSSASAAPPRPQRAVAVDQENGGEVANSGPLR